MKFDFENRVPIDKGWSGDQKFCIHDENGQRYLLRTASLKQSDQKRVEFEYMQKAAALKIPMCLPVEIGLWDDQVYTVHSWIDGKDLEACIQTFTKAQQYAYGLQAGKILKKLHSIPAPKNQPSWALRFGHKMDRKLLAYQNCPLQYKGGEAFMRFIAQNQHLIEDRPQSFQHGDYHIGNMMLDHSGQLVIIDFDRFDFGDPWEEFNRIVWCAQKSPAFASGMVDGYFDHHVPEAFWALLALYISSNTLGSLPWAIPFGQEQIDVMLTQGHQILSWYDNMEKVVPNWYK